MDDEDYDDSHYIKNLHRYNSNVTDKYVFTDLKKKKVLYKSVKNGFFIYDNHLYYKFDADYVICSDGMEVGPNFLSELKTKRLYTEFKLNFVPINMFNEIIGYVNSNVDFINECQKESDLQKRCIQETLEEISSIQRIY